jgi:serine protease
MKRLWLWVGLVLFCALGAQAQQHQYRYSGGPRQFILHTQYLYVLLQPGITQASLERLVPGATVTAWDEQNIQQRLTAVKGVDAPVPGRHWAEVKLNQPLSDREYEDLLSRLNRSREVAFASPYFKAGPKSYYGVSELFYVQLNSEAELPGLMRMANATHTRIMGRNLFLEDWYILAVDKNSRGNALAMAEYFLQEGKFKAANPDVMIPDALFCVNDPLYANQWNITNTGQYGGTPGIDVNACSAWTNWTTGSLAVRVAIFDQGIDVAHPDLAPNIVDPGWNTMTATAPGVLSGAHGTACAGIAGALGDNLQGVTGVARTCGLINIHHTLFVYPGFGNDLANGFNWAALPTSMGGGGIDVVSNSWGWDTLWFGSFPLLNAAISNALINGRGGLGTVVCFATGNSNAAVLYPANSNPDILAVGAMSPCGERKNPASCDGEGWGGSYGPELDVAAPGVKIQTTDNTGGSGYDPSDYYQFFNGTSSACPHVAGLAGLVLTMNPCLTRAQVNNIIERSARKVGGYIYASTLGRPNGGWNNEMGYGLIDVDAALRLTREIFVQNYTYTGSETVQVFGSITAGRNVTPLVPVGDVNVAAGSVVDYRFSTFASLQPGFNVWPGGVLSVMPIPFLNCGPWDETVARRAPIVAAIPALEPEASGQAKAGVPSAWQLEIHPNPVSESAKVKFQVPQTTQVRVDLYDASMRKVGTVLESTQYAAGVHEVTLEGKDLPAGIYFLRMSAEGHTAVRKFAIAH